MLVALRLHRTGVQLLFGVVLTAVTAVVTTAVAASGSPSELGQFAACRAEYASAVKARVCIAHVRNQFPPAKPAVSARVQAPTGIRPRYQTDVDPGSAIDFVSRKVGWRVDGTYAAPWLSGRLVSGPGGTSLDWPGRSISESTDGGAHWTMRKSTRTGIWGLSFLNAKRGWIVGVDSLLGTSDGGGHWQTLGEPSGSPLVKVSFVSTKVGYGLTAANTFVRTQSGGATWRASALGVSATSLCFSSRKVGYIADQRGDVYRTADGGATWSEDYQSTIPSTYPEVWSDLECGARSVWQSIVVISPTLQREAFLVEQRSSRSSRWQPVASDAGGGQPLVSSQSTTAAGFAAIGGVSAGRAGALIVGLPAQGFRVVVVRASNSRAVGQHITAGASERVSLSSPRALALPASRVRSSSSNPFNYIRVLGISLVGDHAWLYALDGAAQADPSVYDRLLLATNDGGAVWHVVNRRRATQPRYQ